MIATQKITVDLNNKSDRPTIDVVQGDGARAVEISLYEGTAAWTIPTDAQVQVRFQNADGTGGCYDTLPDGTKACSISGSTVTVLLAPQTMTVSGVTQLQIVLQSNGAALAAFTVNMTVEPDYSQGTLEPEDYVNLSTWIRDELDNRVETAFTNGGYINSKTDDLHRRLALDFSMGTLDADGKEADQSNRIRSGCFLNAGREMTVVFPAGIKVRCFFYDADHNFVSVSDYKETSFTIFNSAAYGRCVAAYTDDLQVTDVTALAEKIAVFCHSDAHDSFRGSVLGLGCSTFKECTKEGYYRFSGVDAASISDAPEITAGGILEVRPHAGTNVVMQTIHTTAGEIWFRWGSKPFRRLLPQEITESGAGIALNWYALGDSITQGYYSDSEGNLKFDTEMGWAALTAAQNGWNLTNHAVGGSGFVAPGTVLDKLNARDHADTIDFSGAELVTLSYGVNDWKYDMPLGSMEDDVSAGGTVYSNMRYVVEKILSDNPHAKLVVISPINCCAYGGQETNWGCGYSFSNSGTLEDIFHAEREICAYYGIEFIDLLHGSIVNRVNAPEVLPDGVHPSAECHRLLGAELAKKLMGVNPVGSIGDMITVKGADGYTPVRGVDYWTEADQAAMQEDAESFILDEIAKRGQLYPEFANSIEECADKAKLYVLPDGYIYAYMTKTVTTVKPDLSNTEEYLLNTRINSSGVETVENGWYTTNYLPVDMSLADPLTMRFEGTPPFYARDNTNGSISERIVFYDSGKTVLGIYNMYNKGSDNLYSNNSVLAEGSGSQWTVDIGYVFNSTKTEEKASFYDRIAYVRFACNYAAGYNGPSPLTSIDEIPECKITLDAQGGTAETTGWMSTGRAFVPADYEDQLLDLENTAEAHAQSINENSEQIEVLNERISSLENGQGVRPPDYWIDHLDEKAALIRQAIGSAGRNKSAFLWYNDAHWDNSGTYSAKMSPTLLKYLYRHTPINKTAFGGDIVSAEGDDSDTMAYLWQWRQMLRDLPNHHSVVGNHDDGNAVNNRFNGNYVYAYLLAAEECPQIVHGGDFYYYMDDPCEKTRYLYLDTAYRGLDDDQTAFITDALKTTPAGWHIVAIAHIWLDTDYTTTPPSLGEMSANGAALLALFDAYNARGGDFADCGGNVEFCIGGHTHIDHAAASDGGIPVILTEADCLHDRSGLEHTVGTITESAVSAIIADYDANKISVIRIGRGNDREIAI